MRVLTACLLLTMTLPVSAQIYRSIGPNGQPVFSDQPPENKPAERITLPPTNTVGTQTPATPVPAAPAEPEPAEIQSYQTLMLNVPDESSLRANNGTFILTATVEPSLLPGHQLQLFMDGQPYGAPGRSIAFQLTNIDRGTHQFRLDVLQGGRTVQQSMPVDITIQRISRNSPAR
ncbi:uncharacterized protein DUF4124 [Pseudomonas duriflava]|uniref:Uncharacterized protein DUF4124 n=1 Tax=Pseudomonas duriflava TaxID=459528 RepID=A0A562QKQ3_9PSED|nr:DUF4124 domain-containing protein [Pseudomonas duriflava]TWI56626.1 uncharacterized protein DUF4124 [Pseudomonas duriflava]